MTIKKNPIPIYLLLLIVFLTILTACQSEPANPSNSTVPRITLAECQLSAPGLPIRLPARCGTLKVYEDPAAKSGRQIDLNVAVIPAVSRGPAPDPLFFLTGGPGQAATESYLQLSFAFDRINQKREIILVDQRGTGKSNPLDCPGTDEDLQSSISEQEQARVIQNCLSNLDANPALYTTSIAMQDLDQVREALGYETINIYGVSYGTRAALTYLQQFPSRVRSIILDGVVPQSESLGFDVAQDAQRALDLNFNRCASDIACNQAFPNLVTEFENILDNLQQKPVEVTLTHPRTGEIVNRNFTAEEFASAVRLLSYAPETVALLPLLIHTAYTRADYAPLAAQYIIVADQLVESISEGMNFSVLCSEDVPFYTPAESEQANSGTYLGDLQTDALYKTCEIWPRGEVPSGFKQPVEVDVPVLILSGEADPVTPPSNGDLVAQTLSNSLHLVAPGQGHNVIFRGCLPRIATSFIESGTVQGLDTNCVQQIKPMPFFINFSGPHP